MAKKRYINTKFWSDSFIVKLNPEERYLFLYLLTNEHTEICGMYELPMSVMARETGYNIETLSNLLKRLAPKMLYVEEWVYITNFAKNQAANENMKKGAERSLAEVPPKILAKIKEFNERFETLSNHSEPFGKPKPKPKPKPVLKPNTLQPEVADNSSKDIIRVLEVFSKLNPMINYGNKTYRKSITNLLEKIGVDKSISASEYALSIQGDKYAPRISNPYQLETKFGDLVAYKQKQTTNTINLDNI